MSSPTENGGEAVKTPSPITVTAINPETPPLSLHNSSNPRSPILESKFEGAFDDLLKVPKRYSSRRQSHAPRATLGEHGTTPSKPGQETDELPPYVHDWPTQPDSLSPLPEFLYILIDFGLAILPLVAVAYAICAALLNGRPTSSNYFYDFTWSGTLYGPVMMEAQKYVPTLFPMIYGLELARLTKAFALYKAERGTRIGFLEQLIGSQSLAGTVNSLWSLRIFNFVGLGLFALWGLAPVGGNLGLRIIGNNGTYTIANTTSYMSTNATPNALTAGDDQLPFYKYAVDSLYATSILSVSSMTGPQDPWSNVKIPSLEWFEQNNGCGADGWCSLDIINQNYGGVANVTDTSYSSLTGIPVIGGLYGLGFETFSIESSYYAFDCPRPTAIPADQVLYSALPTRSPYDTGNNSAIWDSGIDGYPFSFFLDTNTPYAGIGDAAGDARMKEANPSPRNVVFGSRSNNGTVVANCTMTLTHVESWVACNFSNPLWNVDNSQSQASAIGACKVEKIRRSVQDLRPDGETPFDQSTSIAEKFFKAWPGATGLIPPGTSSATERSLTGNNPTAVVSLLSDTVSAAGWITYNGDEGYVNLASVTAAEFSGRLGLLFNTYWHSFCNLQALTETEVGLGFGKSGPESVMFNNTAMTMWLPGQFYTVNWAFFSIFVFCTAIALLAGVLAVIVKYHTLVPDILGSVCSLTRNNPYTPVPGGASTLDAAEFARHIMHMPVRFVDAQPDRDVGKIVLSTFGTADGQDPSAMSLRPGRLYA